MAFRWASAEHAAALDRLRTLGGWGALVGPHGSGKSTLLRELVGEVRAGGAVHRVLARSDEIVVDLGCVGPDDVVMIDGLDLLGPLDWARVRWRVRRARVVLAASHVGGRLPTLREHAVDRRLVQELVAEVVGGRALDPVAAALHRTHRGDVRRVFRSLYDAWAAGETAEIMV